MNKLVGGSEHKDSSELAALAKQDQGARKLKGLAAVVSSTLFQIGIPDGLESRTYGALYKILVQKGMIPLGLYRGVFPQMKVGPKSNKLSYVFTNPSKETELFSCDRVFVLSPNPVTSHASRSAQRVRSGE